MKQTISLVVGTLAIATSTFCSQSDVHPVKEMRRNLFSKRSYANIVKTKREQRHTTKKEPWQQRQSTEQFTQQEILYIRSEVVPFLQKEMTPEQLQSNPQSKHAEKKKKKTGSHRLCKKLQQTRNELEQERHWKCELEQRLIRHQGICNQYAQRSDAILSEYQTLWKALHNEQTQGQKKEEHIQYLTQLTLDLDQRLFAAQREAQRIEFAYSSECLSSRLRLKAEQKEVRTLKDRIRLLAKQLHSSEVRTYHTERMHQYQATHALALAQTLHTLEQRTCERELTSNELQTQESEWLLASPQPTTTPNTNSISEQQTWGKLLKTGFGLFS